MYYVYVYVSRCMEKTMIPGEPAAGAGSPLA